MRHQRITRSQIKLWLSLSILLALLAFVQTCHAQMQQVDGSKVLQWPANDVVLRFRPWVASDDGGTLTVENKHLFNVTNQKAIYASASSPQPDGSVRTYRSMIFRNLEIENVIRDAAGQAKGLHMDFLYVEGARAGKPFKTDVLVENVYLHNPAGTPDASGAQPLFVTCDGVLGTVTIRNLKVVNGATDNKLDTKTPADSIDTVVIDACPGQRFIVGRANAGRVGQIIVRNSPGVVISNPSNAPITYDTPATVPADPMLAKVAALEARIAALEQQQAKLMLDLASVPRAWRVVPTTQP